MNEAVERERARLIKEGLKIADALGNIDVDDIDKDELEALIERAKKIKSSIYWKLS